MQEHESWILYAEQDLKVAKKIYTDEELIRAVLYHSQQCAEKALKGFLIFNNSKFDRTHDLIKLVRQCIIYDSDFKCIQTIALDLNPYSSNSRYPDNVISMLDLSLAEHSISQAHHILEFVKSKI